MQIHIDRGGQRFGPYSVEEVKKYLADGTLLPSDLGWHDGAADWQPLPQIPGVKPGGPLPPGGPPPPGKPAGPATPTAADAAGASADAPLDGAPMAAKGKGGGAVKIIAIVLAVAALGAGGYFGYTKFFGGDGGDANGTDANGTGGDGNSSNAPLASVPTGWETLPDGALIAAGAEAVIQLKAGAILKSPLVQGLIRNHDSTPSAPGSGGRMLIGRQIQFIQSESGFNPYDIQDITISASGISQTFKSVDSLDERAMEKAFEDALANGFRPAAAQGPVIHVCAHVRLANDMTKKTLDLIDGNVPPEIVKEHGDTKYYILGDDPNNPDDPDPVFAAAYFPDKKSAVIGSESAIVAHIDGQGSFSARQGLDLLDSKMLISAAFVPSDPSLFKDKLSEAAQGIPDDAPPEAQALAGAAQEITGGALGGGIAGNTVRLAATGKFSEATHATTFADNFNKLLDTVRKTPQAAQVLLMLQSQGIQLPQATADMDKASLVFGVASSAIANFENIANALGGGGPGPGGPGPGTGGNGAHSQRTRQAWRQLSQVAQLPAQRWPTAQQVMQSMGQPQNQAQAATLNLRTLINPSNNRPNGLGAFNPQLLTPQERQAYQLTGMRLDYHDQRGDDSRAIRLYFRPQTGQLIGIEWYEAGPDKTGPPRSGDNNNPGGPGQGEGKATGGGSAKAIIPGRTPPRPPGATTKAPPSRPKAAARAMPQTASEAEKFLTGEWAGSATATNGVTITFKDPRQMTSTGGSRPIVGQFQVLSVSGNQMTIWAVNRGNLAQISFNNPNQMTLHSTIMKGFLPLGTYQRK